MFRYCFLFLQELDQKKSIFKVVNIILSIIHFLLDQIQACFTHDSPPLYCMACSLYLTFSHAQNGGRPPFSLLTSPSPCLSPPPPISLSPAPPPLCFTSWPVPYRKWLPRCYTPDGADPTLVISGFFDFSSPENLNLLLPLLDDCRSTWNLIIEPFSSTP